MRNGIPLRHRLSASGVLALGGALVLAVVALRSNLDAPLRLVAWCAATITLGGAMALGYQIARRVLAPLEQLAAEVDQVQQAVAAGNFDVRVEGTPVGAEVASISTGMNAVLDKVSWLQSILDAVPFPIHVTDADMKWTYMNRPFEALLQREGRIENRRSALGMACSNAAANICNTEKCGIRQLQKGVPESFFDWCGMQCKQDTAGLVDRHGRRTGYVEVVTDLTPLLRSRDYTQVEIQRLTENLSRLAAGDFSLDLRLAEGDKHTTQARADFVKLRDALATTAKGLEEVLHQVVEVAEGVSTASAQIAATSGAVAGGATEQAQTLTSTSTRLEDMSAMTKQSATHAEEAARLTLDAKSAASDGTTAMEQMSQSMGRIRASAEGTSQIIRDINEIAFQTNLLALNAAVEAARAGEAGRGFAVVADEVRSLALRAKEAARKTEELIHQSVTETEEGAARSRDVSEKLMEIAAGITKVTEIVTQISKTTGEQSSGITSITKSVGEMERVTQQNAASAEESSAASQEMASQSQSLVSLVSRFKFTKRAPAQAPTLAPTTTTQSRGGRKVHLTMMH